ncbi:MAG: hypothetical protein WA966_09725 [Ornithinimicrobium sp.]
MSFTDLPAHWPRLPLTTVPLVHDVLDLCVSNADRLHGGLAVLVLRDDLTLAQPIFVRGPVPVLDRHETVKALLRGASGGERERTFVIAIVHQHPRFTDEDRALHQTLIDACTELGFTLLSAHLLADGRPQLLPRAPSGLRGRRPAV